MLRNRLYYSIKPLLPSSFRFAIRRWFALRKRRRVESTWPIAPGSELPPKGWLGWPDGKRFALVLTHDVEGQSGLDKVTRLMELEIQLGFRSAFNLIPEGQYRSPRELRQHIRSKGFEVGIHDLYHDGKLFLTRREFSRRAVQINRYLKDWGVNGFRSGFMLHNLDWIHDLNVAYDASTFDTDPFEPQPYGQETIFPFWVSASVNGSQGSGNGAHPPLKGPGYVELPYTLPQDSTLFLLLGERHPDIWFQKLDWIVRHGGMALVNVHPDYARFDGDPDLPRSYPVGLYTRFLEYVLQRYGHSFWQPLPGELASFIARQKTARVSRGRRICMVTHSFYGTDARVARYAEALAERGDQVDVLALQASRTSPTIERVGRVNLVRLQSRFGKSEKRRLSYLIPVLRFLVLSAFWITRQHARKPYDLLHIHNVPDFLVFAGWYPRLTGARIILDIHDIVPEFYASKFNQGQESYGVSLLKRLERASARFAHHVIIANHLWHGKYSSRTGTKNKCSVFINNVDTTVFRPFPRHRRDGKFQVIFPGGLQWHQGLDIAIRAFQKVSAQLPHAEFHIYGDGNMKSAWIALAKELGLEQKVLFFQPLPLREIAEIMANADLGIVPKRADSFGDEAYSTKIMEFMSVGVPVVISSTRIDRFYFNDTIVKFFPSGDHEALANAILEVAQHDSLRQQLVANGAEYVARNSWDCRKHTYLRLVDSLIATGRADAEFSSPSEPASKQATSGAPSSEKGQMLEVR